MPQISRFPLTQEAETAIQKALLEIFELTSNQQQALHLISNLLTQTERIMLAKRLGIALMLKQKYSYEAIKNVLKVSQGTIANIKFQLNQNPNSEYHHLLDKLILRKKVDVFFATIDNLLLKIPKKGNWKGWGSAKLKSDLHLHRRRQTPR